MADQQQGWPPFGWPTSRKREDTSNSQNPQQRNNRIITPPEEGVEQSNERRSWGLNFSTLNNQTSPPGRHGQASTLSYLPHAPAFAPTPTIGSGGNTEILESMEAQYNDLIHKLRDADIEIPGHTDKARNRPPMPTTLNTSFPTSNAGPSSAVGQRALPNPIARPVHQAARIGDISPRIVENIDSLLSEEAETANMGYFTPNITPPQAQAGEVARGFAQAQSPQSPIFHSSFAFTAAPFLPCSAAGNEHSRPSMTMPDRNPGPDRNSNTGIRGVLSRLALEQNANRRMPREEAGNFLDAHPRRTTFTTLGPNINDSQYNQNSAVMTRSSFPRPMLPTAAPFSPTSSLTNYIPSNIPTQTTTFQLSPTVAPFTRRPDFEPMRMVVQQHTTTQHLTPYNPTTTLQPRPALTLNTGCSPAYMGNHHLPSNRSADIPDRDNCSFFITGLPPTITTHRLLTHIRDVGRVFASYINGPSTAQNHLTAAAKLVFFEKAAAQRFYARHREHLPLMVEGFAAKVVRNRIKVEEPDWPRGYTRVVVISGPREVVSREGLLEAFEEKFVFHVDEILEREDVEREGWRTVEIRFGSWRSQAQTTFQVLRDHPGFRGVVIRYGRDPCDRVFEELEEEVGDEGGVRIIGGVDGPMEMGRLVDGGEEEQGDERARAAPSPGPSTGSSGPGGGVLVGPMSPGDSSSLFSPGPV